MTKICIIILGMHRSGTSALSGILHDNGIFFGKTLMPPAFDNAKGFFENERILNINESIFRILGRQWHDTRPMPDDWLLESEILMLLKKAKELVEDEFSSARFIAIKDPRLCLLLPFWRKVLESHGYQIKVIVLMRSISAIRQSLARRNHFNMAKTDMLAALHLLHAFKTSMDLNPTVLHFEKILKGNVEELNELASIIGLSDQPLRMEFLSPSLTAKPEGPENVGHPIPEVDHYIQDLYITLNKWGKTTKGIVGSGAIEELLSLHNLLSDRYSAIAEDVPSVAQLWWRGTLDAPYEGGINFEIQHDKCTLIQLFDPKIHIVELVIRPKNTAGLVVLSKINFSFADQPMQYNIDDNSIRQFGNVYEFDVDYPKLIFTFNRPVLLTSLEIDLTYTANIAVSRNENRYSFCVRYLKLPINILGLINLENYRILRSALRRESPNQIWRNIKKRIFAKEREHAAKSRLATGTGNPLGQLKVRKPLSSPYKIVYIVPTLPEFDTSSGGRRATRLLGILSEYAEICIFSRTASKLEYRKLFESMNISVIDNSNSQALKSKFPDVDILIYAWYYMYYDAAELRKIYPWAQCIIDSVDIHWVREERTLTHSTVLSVDRVYHNKNRELAAYRNIDQVWVVSADDQAFVLEEDSTIKTHIISNIHEVIQEEYLPSDRPNILFFGGFTHYPNIQAALRLAKEIIPKVALNYPDVGCIIAGANMPEEIILLGQLAHITCINQVPEAEVANLYNKVRLVVVPLLSGAGVKGKITEAISHRVPVITNRIGNEGIHLVHAESGLLAETDTEFVDCIQLALAGHYDLASIANSAAIKLRATYGAEVARHALIRSLFKKIDICIVTWNRLELLKKCIQSLLSYTNYPNYRILIYSNGCTDGTYEYLQGLQKNNEQIHTFFSQTNDVFVRPNNKMMAYDPFTDKVLLNNDVEVSIGWLSELNRMAYRHQGIGIVGAKVLYPDGVLQEFGAEINPDRTGMNVGKGDHNPFDKPYRKSKAVGYVSACAMYIKQSTIEHIGYLDDEFHPCYAEDSEFCYRAWLAGIFTVVTPRSIVYHHEGASAGTSTNEGFKKFQLINLEKFWKLYESHYEEIQKRIKRANKTLTQGAYVMVDDRNE